MQRFVKKTYLVALASGAIASMAHAQSLTTLFNSNNSGSAGGAVYFDAQVAGTPLTITGFDVNTTAAAGTPVGFTVYTTPFSRLGAQTNQAVWTQVATGSGTSAGSNAPTQITLNNTFDLSANTSYGIAIVLAAPGFNPVSHAYSGTGTSPAPGQTTYSNSELTLNLGEASNVAFTAPLFQPRIWNGTIEYIPSDPTATGACCFANGTCQVLTGANCLSQGGSFSGPNTTCGAGVCPQPGACCFANGTCNLVQQTACTASGGFYQGNGSACTTCPAPAGPAMALDLINATPRFLLFPANYPSTANTLPTIFDGFAMDFNSDATVLYGISYPSNEWGTIDPDTGTFTFINVISGAGAGETNWSGLSVDPTNGTIYAVAVTAAGSNLYTVDAATGATTLIGNMGIDLIIDIAFNSQGVLYATSISTDNLFTVDKTNGALTLVGPLGLNLNFAQGMDFDYSTDTLYAAFYTTSGSYGTINTQTGAATVIRETFPEAELAIRVPLNSGPQCYANCDESTQNPVLNVADFSCFLTKFAANDPYANCDGSTQQPVLNVADFSCFLTKFAAGCP